MQQVFGKLKYSIYHTRDETGNIKAVTLLNIEAGV